MLHLIASENMGRVLEIDLTTWSQKALLCRQGVYQHKQAPIRNGLPLTTAENWTRFQIEMGRFWLCFNECIYEYIWIHQLQHHIPLFGGYSHGKCWFQKCLVETEASLTSLSTFETFGREVGFVLAPSLLLWCLSFPFPISFLTPSGFNLTLIFQVLPFRCLW